MTIEHFNVTGLIQSVIKSSSLLIDKSGAELEFDSNEDCYVWADQFMIEEVIRNYLTNAIHYVIKGGRIRIWYEYKEDSVRINVYNDGLPIPDKDLEKLFIKFYKVDTARTREYGGSGIGLSIVAAIMKNHHQDYGVFNADDGVVFYFELDTKGIE
jgi:signal transduction histidine kinase